MKVPVTALILSLGCLLWASSLRAAAESQDAASPRSIWAGVYTKTQSARGAQLYSERCATCHGADLAGAEMAPAVAGGGFLANWNELPLADLFERVRSSMPADAPGSLGRQQVADIVAFMLQRSACPPGEVELATRNDALGLITIRVSKE